MADQKKETVGDDMRSRRCFYPERDDSGDMTKTALEQAQEYLAASMTRFDDFGDFPFAAPGVSEDEDGNAVFDTDSVYTDDVGVMVGKLNRVANKEKGIPGGTKCIFMAPIPDFPHLIANEDEDSTGEAFTKWATSILEKEANHVAVRPLRDAEDVSTVVDQMPTSVDAYTTSGRGIGAGIMVAFNELYKAINATLSAKVSAWAKARLIKSELKRSMESSAYALEYYAPLEDRGDNDSLFVIALNMGVNAAKKKGLDPTIFERWLATRDQKAFTASDEDEDEELLDLDDLTDSLLAEDKPEEEAAEEGDTDGKEIPADAVEPAAKS